jgi:pimeloyl-ACP methyl ester carboxylesterase
MDDVFIKLDLTTVYGKLAGDPVDPLVLGIHGWSQRNGWHTWEPLMRPLANAGYCVVSVDMPGWGSSPAMDNLPLGGARAVSVVIDIMDGLQKESAVLLGKSWGGGVAVATAAAYPERVASLVLTAPALRDLDQMSNVGQPVLLTWAEDDPMIPFVMAEQIVAKNPDIEFISYEMGGHSAAQKNAEDFAPHVVEFLKTKKP